MSAVSNAVVSRSTTCRSGRRARQRGCSAGATAGGSPGWCAHFGSEPELQLAGRTFTECE